MKNNKRFFSVFLFLLLTLDLFAIEGKIKVFVKENDTVYTSQKVTIAIELMTDAFSISDAKITFPNSEEYIVQAPQSADYLSTVDINGSDWQLVHYEYALYALRAGEISIPSLHITFFASMGYGQPKKEFDFQSKVLKVNIKSPEGVKGDHFVLVTDKYSLESEIEPKKQQLIVGDAVELRITQKAHGVLDILLKPFVYRSNNKVRVYDKEPKLKSGLKGDFDVSRTDSFTFVANMEGNVTIPAQESVWWNVTTKKVHKERIPAMTFEIIADPQIAIDAKKAQQKLLLLYLIAILLFLLILYRVFGSKIRNYMKERKQLYKEGEAGRFNTLLDTCQNDDISKLYHDLYKWLEVADPESSRIGFRAIIEQQPSFSKALSQLEEMLVMPERSFDRTDFMKELKKFRERLLEQHQYGKQGLPQSINPI